MKQRTKITNTHDGAKAKFLSQPWNTARSNKHAQTVV